MACRCDYVSKLSCLRGRWLLRDIARPSHSCAAASLARGALQAISTLSLLPPLAASCSYNGSGLVVEVWSECLGATLVNATRRRLAASQASGDVELEIATYLRVYGLATARASSAAFTADLAK